MLAPDFASGLAGNPHRSNLLGCWMRGQISSITSRALDRIAPYQLIGRVPDVMGSSAPIADSSWDSAIEPKEASMNANAITRRLVKCRRPMGACRTGLAGVGSRAARVVIATACDVGCVGTRRSEQGTQYFFSSENPDPEAGPNALSIGDNPVCRRLRLSLANAGARVAREQSPSS